MARILVIDDDATVRAYVDMALEEIGHEVLAAEHGAAALTLLDAQAAMPDVILLDMRMPKMDGWEFARLYQARPGPKVPIVVMTAAQDAAGRAAQIHADSYLAKPFDLDDLYDCVARHVSPAST
jgi:two-component system, chemotaxis family, chemotaxis protein CheY